MWTIVSKLLIQLVIGIISDKVLVSSASDMLLKAVRSKTVGIDNKDARNIIDNVAESTLNTLEQSIYDREMARNAIRENLSDSLY